MRLSTILAAALVLSLPVSAGAQRRDGFRVALNVQGAADVHYDTVITAREAGTGMATGRRLAGVAKGELQAWSFRIDEKGQIAFKAEIQGLRVRPNRALRKLAVDREGYRFLVDQPGLFIGVTDAGVEIAITEPGVHRLVDDDLGIAIDEPGVHVALAGRGAHFSIGEPGVQ